MIVIQLMAAILQSKTSVGLTGLFASTGKVNDFVTIRDICRRVENSWIYIIMAVGIYCIHIFSIVYVLIFFFSLKVKTRAQVAVALAGFYRRGSFVIFQVKKNIKVFLFGFNNFLCSIDNIKMFKKLILEPSFLNTFSTNSD